MEKAKNVVVFDRTGMRIVKIENFNGDTADEGDGNAVETSDGGFTPNGMMA